MKLLWTISIFISFTMGFRVQSQPLKTRLDRKAESIESKVAAFCWASRPSAT
jgi:hypothetical protein